MNIELGELAKAPGDRDAIHVAVLSAKAAETLYPGSRVRLIEGKARISTDGKGIGIVDPWLWHAVFSGETFWILLHQNTITDLRHVWKHPEIQEKKKRLWKEIAIWQEI